jgi:hypothetical protein
MSSDRNGANEEPGEVFKDTIPFSGRYEAESINISEEPIPDWDSNRVSQR